MEVKSHGVQSRWVYFYRTVQRKDKVLNVGQQWEETSGLEAMREEDLLEKIRKFGDIWSREWWSYETIRAFLTLTNRNKYRNVDLMDGVFDSSWNYLSKLVLYQIKSSGCFCWSAKWGVAGRGNPVTHGNRRGLMGWMDGGSSELLSSLCSSVSHPVNH